MIIIIRIIINTVKTVIIIIIMDDARHLYNIIMRLYYKICIRQTATEHILLRLCIYK